MLPSPHLGRGEGEGAHHRGPTITFVLSLRLEGEEGGLMQGRPPHHQKVFSDQG